ncbi:MAG: hypothetical protein ABH872_03050 [Candidatus Omnitrophota bacterium]
MKKSVSLIIALSILIILSLIGWTLVNFISSDLEISSRMYESERCLYVAESGMDWMLKRFTTVFDCDFDGDGKNIDTGTVLHNMKYGQYRINCTCSEAKCENTITVESTGYMPQETDYRAMRQIELTVNRGSFSKAGTIKSLLDWSDMDSSSRINGDIQVLVPDIEGSGKGFEGDGDGITNEAVDKNIPGTGTRIAQSGTYPLINMNYYKQEAQSRGNLIDYSQTATLSLASTGTTIIVNTPNFFSPEDEGQAIRNLTRGNWGDSDWAVIVSVGGGGGGGGGGSSSQIEVDWPAGDLWNQFDQLRLVKRFEGNNNNQGLWYVEGSDILIDVRDKNCSMENTSSVAEGDILIRGAKNYSTKTHVEPSTHETFPNFSTQEGNIYSTDTPSQGKKGRTFDGLIYTENGKVEFNCIDGVAIMGDEVYLDGDVLLKYTPKYVDPGDGFLGGVISVTEWREK